VIWPVRQIPFSFEKRLFLRWRLVWGHSPLLLPRLCCIAMPRCYPRPRTAPFLYPFAEPVLATTPQLLFDFNLAPFVALDNAPTDTLDSLASLLLHRRLSPLLNSCSFHTSHVPPAFRIEVLPPFFIQRCTRPLSYPVLPPVLSSMASLISPPRLMPVPRQPPSNCPVSASPPIFPT